jgi:hypothetical protein
MFAQLQRRGYVAYENPYAANPTLQLVSILCIRLATPRPRLIRTANLLLSGPGPHTPIR